MKKAFKVIFTFSLTLFLFFLFIEAYLRFTEISLPSYFIDDPKLGTKFRPNSKVTVIEEGFYMGRINEYGLPGPSYGQEKDSGCFRIALIGDSYIEGFHIFDQFHFARKMEGFLSLDKNPKVEVLNFGKAGLNISLMYITYKEMALNYKPDLTLFFVGPGDLHMNTESLEPKCFIENDSLKIDFGFSKSESFKKKLQLSFLRKSSFYSLIKNAYTIFKSGEFLRIFFDKFYFMPQQERKSDNIYSDKKYFSLNKSIIKNLFENNNLNILVTMGELPISYKHLLKEIDANVFELHNFLNSEEKNGISYSYWKATKSYGHWNHEAHNIIGRFLGRNIRSIFNFY
jgi:hypothetical protein